MSNDTIKRSDAIKATWQEPTYTDPLNVLTEVRDRIEAIPSADRLQGEWIIHKINGIPHTAECSCCHNHYDYEDLRRIGRVKEIIVLPYCPSCGARMKGADDEP